MLRRARHYFLDLGVDRVEVEPAELRRLRVIALCTWVLILFSVVYASLNLFGGKPLVGALNLGSIGMGLVVLGLIRAGMGASAPATVLVGCLGVLFSMTTHLAGGPRTPDTVWLLLLPQLGVALGGFRAGFVASAYTVALFALLFGLDLVGIYPEYVIADDWYGELIGALLATVIVNAFFMWNLEREMRQRREAEERALEGERAKSTFLATLSHEIRTPLHGVLGTAEVLGRQPLPDEDARRVETILRSGRMLRTLLDDVLEVSRGEAAELPIHPIVMDLPRMVRECVDLFEQRVQPGVCLEIVVDPSTPQWVLGDESRLRQILGNLVGNAVKFTREGCVRVWVGADPGDADAVRMEVQDTGPGIAPERREDIFEPFRQATRDTHQRFGGTGLGLAIVSRLARGMGGRVELDSTLGYGSTFRVVVPLPRAEAPGRPVHKELTASHVALPVLVVDDNPVNLMVAAGMLKSLGHTVIQASSGEAALQILADELIDIVLLDISMPGMDGPTVLAHIRRDPSLAGLPVCALTAHVLAGDRERFLEMGFDAVLNKPLSIDTLNEGLEGVLTCPVRKAG